MKNYFINRPMSAVVRIRFHSSKGLSIYAPMYYSADKGEFLRITNLGSVHVRDWLLGGGKISRILFNKKAFQ